MLSNADYWTSSGVSESELQVRPALCLQGTLTLLAEPSLGDPSGDEQSDFRTGSESLCHHLE